MSSNKLNVANKDYIYSSCIKKHAEYSCIYLQLVFSNQEKSDESIIY